MTIQAIQTQYAGCLFRSRLEARWAVFFDTAGITWQYEQQGYSLPWRLSLEPDAPFPYLPDFWLPGLGLFVEVKGALTPDGCLKLINAAAALSAPEGGCNAGGATGSDLLLLGEVPRAMPGYPTDFLAAQWRLHMHKGRLYATHWPSPKIGPTNCPFDNGDGHWLIGSDYGGDQVFQVGEMGKTPPAVARSLLERDWRDAPEWYVRAALAASSARFEHGQSGATLSADDTYLGTTADDGRYGWWNDAQGVR